MSVEFDEALAWVQEDKSRGYRKAAKRFGLNAAKLKQYARNKRTQAAAAAERPPPQPADDADQVDAENLGEFEAWKAADPTREEVLAWMEEHGAGYKRAAAHFGLNVNTVKSWQRRREQYNGGAIEGEDFDPDQTTADYLQHLIQLLEDRMHTARANQLPGLVKQAREVFAELQVVREAERVAAGEFKDPREMISRIITALEGSVQLLEPQDVDRLYRVVEKGLRLTAATRPPQPSDDPPP